MVSGLSSGQNKRKVKAQTRHDAVEITRQLNDSARSWCGGKIVSPEM